MTLWFCPFRWCESNVIGLSSGPTDGWGALLLRSLVETFSLFLWMKLVPITVGFCDCKPGAMAPVADICCFEFPALQGHFNANGQKGGRGGQHGVLATGKRWGGVSCWNYHVPLSQWWEAPGESKLLLAQWGMVSMLPGWGCQQQQNMALLWIHLSERKMLPCFLRFCISSVSCGKTTAFFPFRLMNIF